MRLPARLANVLLSVLLACACSPGSEQGTSPDAGRDTASGLVRLEAGFEGTLQLRGNMLRIHVTDTAGTPVEATRVSVSLWMPGHGHGAPAPAVTREARGDYLATVDFTMPGTWTVTIQVDTEGRSDTLELSVEAP
ncbi:FixH family protein [Cystobacter ferrugineus]|nr:FixH family protein [Cystobacter ferrugineus]